MDSKVCGSFTAPRWRPEPFASRVVENINHVKNYVDQIFVDMISEQYLSGRGRIITLDQNPLNTNIIPTASDKRDFFSMVNILDSL